jgi:hypothetical protein
VILSELVDSNIIILDTPINPYPSFKSLDTLLWENTYVNIVCEGKLSILTMSGGSLWVCKFVCVLYVSLCETVFI